MVSKVEWSNNSEEEEPLVHQYEMRIFNKSQASEKEQTFLPETTLVDFNSPESFMICLL